jgi:hypothetical protein
MGGDKRIDDLKVQMDSVNYKLEKLIKMLEGSKPEAKTVVAPKAEATKAETKIVTAPKVEKVAKAEKPAAKKAAPKKK